MSSQSSFVVNFYLMSLLFGPLKVSAQVTGEPNADNAYHPLLVTKSYNPGVDAQNEALMARIRESSERHTVCQHDVCIKSAPNPYSPAATSVDFSSEQAFLAYVQASMEISRCGDKLCAEAAVQRIPGAVRVLESAPSEH